MTADCMCCVGFSCQDLPCQHGADAKAKGPVLADCAAAGRKETFLKLSRFTHTDHIKKRQQIFHICRDFDHVKPCEVSFLLPSCGFGFYSRFTLCLSD